jgi:hypothetical protein
MQSTPPERSLLARLALTANIVIGVASLLAALAVIDLARMKPWPPFIVAASLFGIASFLLLWETIVIVRQSRTGTMPVAMSLERPLGWLSLATILVASLLLVGPFVGVVPD